MSAASLAEGLPPLELEPLEGPDSDEGTEQTPPIPGGALLAGRYSVDTVLAQGGMGVVWLGRHIELDKPVAIKFLRRSLCGKEAVVGRFLNEARAAAVLRSNHVVRVMDVGQLDTGRPYLVMEHLEGTDLDALVEADGPLPVERAIEYALQVCEALAEAHGAGIVHRDIKPENLFLSQGGPAKATVKVVDFGLAKRLDGAGAKVITGPLENMGSPCYMSPEQIGSPQQVDERTDIWSLGVVLYRLVTGALPFDGDSLAEVCARVLNASPKPLAEHNPDLDASLQGIVARCLEKKPEDRYASIDELRKALERYVQGAVSATRPAQLTESALRTLAPPKPPSDPEASASPPSATAAARPPRLRSIALALLLGFMIPLIAVAGVLAAERVGYRPLEWTEGWLVPAALSKDVEPPRHVAPLPSLEAHPTFVPVRGDTTKGVSRATAERELRRLPVPPPTRARPVLRAPVVPHLPKPEEELTLTPEEIVRRKVAYEEYLRSQHLEPIGEALQQINAGLAPGALRSAVQRSPAPIVPPPPPAAAAPPPSVPPPPPAAAAPPAAEATAGSPPAPAQPAVPAPTTDAPGP